MASRASSIGGKMMTRILQVALVMAGGLGLIPAALADAQSDQLAGTSQRLEMKRRVLALFDEEKFDDLERMAQESRSQKRRLMEGWWELAYFYNKLARENVPQSQDDWQRVLNIAQRWRLAKPQSITPRIVLANAWARFAWYSRGGETNPSVTAEERRLFFRRLAKSRQILEEAESLPVKDPELYHVMQVVARAEGWPRERYETLFRKATQLEPTYYSYYYEKAKFLLPQWYGEPGDVENFAAEAADATHPQEGEVIYALVACESYWSVGEGEFFQKYKFHWPRIKQGFEDFDKRYPNSMINLNFFCHMACVAGDSETARHLFERIGSNRLDGYWANEGQFEQWKRWSRGEAAPPVSVPQNERAAGSRLKNLLKHLLSW
jgi:hypothetical protein